MFFGGYRNCFTIYQEDNANQTFFEFGEAIYNDLKMKSFKKCCRWATCTAIHRFVKLSDEFCDNNNWFTIYQQDMPIKPSLYLARLFTMTSKWRALRSTCCQWATPASPSIKARYDNFNILGALINMFNSLKSFKTPYLFDNFHTTIK